ncbi:hypothetical protein N0V95_009231 [Ascochyta clinopodiicola]|nr:hypothetical protein N0V95_009231 [Ascochyta clinopodiicola]
MVNTRNLKRSKADSEDGDVPGLDTLTTASLAKLQSTDERRLLDVVDKLRRTGLNGTIELPQLVVCGDQSSGKSSVLEAITEIPFPRKAGLCTRFATEIILRRESKISVTVKIVPSKYRSEAEQKTLSAFNKTMLYVNQLPDLIDAATQEMGLGKIGASKAFSRDVLSVEICGPDRPQLTLVDLPGLIHSATKASSEEDKRLIHALVGEYMQNPRTIILAVVSAKNDAANQVILSLFKEYDKTGSRTLGIITKPDCMSAEDQQQWFDLALNKEVFLERGWHIVKNWTEPNVQHTAKQRNDAERAFFKEGPFKDFPPHMIGVEALCDRLSKLLLRHLTQELPSLQREMQSKLDDTNTELLKLGDKRETPAEQRMVLMKISMKINHIIASAVNGHYLHEFFGTVDLESSVESNNNIRRFRAVVQNLNHEFAENMRTRGHTYSFESEEEKNKAAAQAANESGERPGEKSGEKSGGPLDANADAKSNAKSDKKSEKPTKKQRETKKASIKDTNTNDDLPTPKRLSYDEAMDWVKDTIVRCRGHELPGSVNPEVTSHLFWEQSVPWRAITQDHIAKVRAVCKEFICQILEHAAPTEFVKPLEDLLITSALEQTHEDANKEFGKLLTDNARHPSTYDHTYSDSLQKKRNKKYSDLTASARQAATTPQYLATDGKPAGSQFDSAMFQQLMSRAVERNMLTFAAEEALESQNAYYADKLRYFIHAVTCQVVERCMVDPLPLMLLSPMVVTGMSDEQVEFVAGELPETVLRRAFFQERKAMLEMGFEIFRDAVGGVKRVRTCL